MALWQCSINKLLYLSQAQNVHQNFTQTDTKTKTWDAEQTVKLTAKNLMCVGALKELQ